MSRRIEYYKVAPEAAKIMMDLGEYLNNTGLESSLLELVKMRASQINGCGYCLDMHSKDARAAGETEQRLYCLPAWRETAFYNERERAALELTEHLTLVAERGVPDELYERVKAQFSEKELADLVFTIVGINGWNRLNVAFEPEVGGYQPGMFSAATTTA
ncbi:MAG: carboxymuconolactone decarboxylase family protein [Acidobacteria bacterium]|jgi:AhpD family alkylhydroperoxidase|nr:carboxymuconolactone decarboxylase family protein [Acidobacteriota bacterium]